MPIRKKWNHTRPCVFRSSNFQLSAFRTNIGISEGTRAPPALHRERPHTPGNVSCARVYSCVHTAYPPHSAAFPKGRRRARSVARTSETHLGRGDAPGKGISRGSPFPRPPQRDMAATTAEVTTPTVPEPPDAPAVTAAVRSWADIASAKDEPRAREDASDARAPSDARHAAVDPKAPWAGREGNPRSYSPSCSPSTCR